MNIETNDIKKIKSIFSKADKNTLVMFDVDEVLFHPTDQILKSKHRLVAKEYEKALAEALPPNQVNDYISIIWEEHKTEVVNQEIPGLIADLQNKKIKTLALTACMAGKFGKINSMEDWRYNDLKNLNYNFELSWPDLQTKIFDQFTVDQLGYYPTYHRGVTYASLTSKGKVLEAFLSYANYTPKKIIFLDDLLVNIESVQIIAQNLDIEYHGIHYTSSIDSIKEDLNLEIAKLQYDILFNEKKWISDNNAKNILLNHNS